MIGLLAKIIPLDLASTLSPGIFALAIVLLGSQNHPQKRILSLLTGSLVAGIAITILGVFLGLAAPSGMGQSNTSAIIDIVLGILLLGLGFQALFGKERAPKPQSAQAHQMIKWLLIGFAISITNLDAAFLNFTAAKEVGGAQNIDDAIKIILLAVNLIFFTLPITLPLIIYLIFPKWADRVLSAINRPVVKYSKYIMFVLLVAFGIYLTYRGIAHFL